MYFLAKGKKQLQLSPPTSLVYASHFLASIRINYPHTEISIAGHLSMRTGGFDNQDERDEINRKRERLWFSL